MLVNKIIYSINLFFLAYMFLYSLAFFITTVLSSFNLDDFTVRRDFISSSYLNNDSNFIPISILVPAYNEAITIIDSIESLLQLDYPLYEILVINDGSTDATLRTVIDYYDLKKVKKPYRRLVPSKIALSIYQNDQKIKITLVHKVNGGKSDALNLGINMSSFPMFVCIDADSVIKNNALKKIIQPFLEDDTTVAVGGNIKVSNGMTFKDGEVSSYKGQDKLIVKFQKIEYLRVFLNSRVSLDGFNGNLIISGAFGLYNKQAVVNVGGYSHDLMGEDMEVIVKIHSFYRKNNLDYSTAYVPDAICYTEVPEKIKVLKKQRRRWHVGLGESLALHKYMMFNPSYGFVGLISFPYFFFFEWLTPYLEILGMISITVSYFLGIINLKFFFFYLLIFIGFNALISVISTIIDKFVFSNKAIKEEVPFLFFYSILEAFGYRQMVSLFRIGNIINFRQKNTWGDMERVDRKEHDSINS